MTAAFAAAGLSANASFLALLFDVLTLPLRFRFIASARVPIQDSGFQSKRRANCTGVLINDWWYWGVAEKQGAEATRRGSFLLLVVRCRVFFVDNGAAAVGACRGCEPVLREGLPTRGQELDNSIRPWIQ
jgi:hypothetical protein